jgi:hypothetical protein
MLFGIYKCFRARNMAGRVVNNILGRQASSYPPPRSAPWSPASPDFVAVEGVEGHEMGKPFAYFASSVEVRGKTGLVIDLPGLKRRGAGKQCRVVESYMSGH